MSAATNQTNDAKSPAINLGGHVSAPIVIIFNDDLADICLEAIAHLPEEVKVLTVRVVSTKIFPAKELRDILRQYRYCAIIDEVNRSHPNLASLIIQQTGLTDLHQILVNLDTSNQSQQLAERILTDFTYLQS